MNRDLHTTQAQSIQHAVETLYRQESRRVLATLIRLLGNFELAEEALQDAFIAAVEQWPQSGLPQNPRAWLISGFYLIDARDLNEAIHIAANVPAARVGSVEVRPVRTLNLQQAAQPAGQETHYERRHS